MAAHDINWNAIYGFWLVAKCGSFAEAARRIPSGTVQALHKRIRQLEREEGLNLKLLKSRGVKGIDLTEAGRQLHKLIDPVFSSFDLLAAELRQEDSGPLTLATTGFAAHNYVPQVLASFHAVFPKVSVSVRVRSEADVISLAESGQVDFAIGASPAEPGTLVVTARTRLMFRLVAPRDHDWPRTPITWAQIMQRPLILHERASVLRRALEELLTRRGLISRLNIAAEATTPELATEMVRGGFGVALIPLGPRLAESLQDLSVVEPPPGLPNVDIAVMQKRGLYLPTYMERFREIAAAVIRS